MNLIANFSDLATPYHKARRGFDLRVFEHIENKIDDLKGKNILDVGCGTGIASRKLAAYEAIVVGTDISEQMLNEAKKINKGIQYICAPTHSLPFSSKSFDLVTAFSAFHWFTDENSINEIKRVLVDDGVFVVINKHDVAGIRKEVVKIFKKYTNQISGKNSYDPQQILTECGFRDVQSTVFKTSESYTLEEATTYLKSIALWNSISQKDRPAIEREIKDFCSTRFSQTGTLDRKIETIVVSGNRP